MSLPRRGLLLASPALLATGSARGQGGFPARPVRIVVPYPPGGGVDALARPLAQDLSALWGQPVTVDNRGGGNTVPGMDHVARSPADGYVLLLTSDSSITSNPHLYASLPSDPVRDLAPVTLLTAVHQMVVAHPALPARSMEALVEAARAAPARIGYASYGPGSQPQLLFESLKAERGIDLLHVPYRGLAPAMTAVVAGEAQLTLAGAGIAAGQVAGGALRPLAIGRPQRLPGLPEVPTLAELGMDHIDPRTWFGLFAPAATPPAVLAAIGAAVGRVMAEPDFAARHVTGRGQTSLAGTPKEAAAFIRRDLEEKARLIRTSGARLDG